MRPDRSSKPDGRRRRVLLLLAFGGPALLPFWNIAAAAEGSAATLSATERFLVEVFGTPPKPEVVWLTPALQARIQETLGHPYRQARLRYWRANDTVAWILDEIGKEFPITAGFVVRDGKLQDARVLIYRESRGGEIQQSSFLRQFDGAALADDRHLTQRIDGITGATMSVDAMQRMAKTALLLTARIGS